jgi:hypothetical protein
MASVSHGLLSIVFLVVSLTRKTSTSVRSICTTSSGRDAAYCPGTTFVALTPFASLRFKATVRRSMRSTRALIVRRSGSGKPFCAQRALTCSIRYVMVGRSGLRYISWIADTISRSRLASNTKASLRRPNARGSTDDTVPLARYAIIKRYIVEQLTPSSQATASTSTIVSLLSPCRFSKPRIASSRRQPSSLRRCASPSAGTSSSPIAICRLGPNVGRPNSHFKWLRQSIFSRGPLN